MLSSVTLVFYYLYLLLELQLYTSKDLDSDLPWCQFDRKLQYGHMLVKLALSAAFVFNKQGGTVTALIHLGLAFISLYIVYKRMLEAVIFVKNVYYGALIYEML